MHVALIYTKHTAWQISQNTQLHNTFISENIVALPCEEANALGPVHTAHVNTQLLFFFISRQHSSADARYSYSNSVRLSVRLSVTLRYCIEMA